jgi:nitrogen-specific signal transduction histidine kinase
MAMDPAGKMMVLNPSAGRLLGLEGADLVGRPAGEVLKDFPWFIEILKKTLAEKASVSRQEVMLSIRGQENRIGYSTLLISDPQKQLLGSGIIFQVLPKG